LVALLACLLVLAMASGTAAPAATISEAEARPVLPPQGLYEGCSPGAGGDACVQRLETIAAAGFRYVLNYSAWYGSPAAVLRYADTAAALGLQLIWPLNHPAWRGMASLAATYPSLLAPRARRVPGSRRRSTRTRRTGSPLDVAIGLVASHPATWGFYIGDELPRREANRVQALSAAVRRLAPSRPQLYVARPGAARLAPFAGFADVAGADVYPLGSGDPPVQRAARSARSVTAAAGVRTAMVLQAFSWSQYRPTALGPRHPSAARLRAMRDAAIHHANPTLILWYSYQDILRSEDPRRRWRDLIRAAFSPLRRGSSPESRVDRSQSSPNVMVKILSEWRDMRRCPQRFGLSPGFLVDFAYSCF